MKKSAFALALVLVMSMPAFAGNCGFHNLVGEWTRKTELASSPDVKCGNSVKTEKTIFVLVNKGGGKVYGYGQRESIKTFQNKNCSPKMTKFKYPHVELISNGSLSIVSENGAQAVSQCDVNTDRSQLKIGIEVYQRKTQ